MKFKMHLPFAAFATVIAITIIFFVFFSRNKSGDIGIQMPDKIIIHAYGEANEIAPASYQALMAMIDLRIPHNIMKQEGSVDIAKLKRTGRTLELVYFNEVAVLEFITDSILFPLEGPYSTLMISGNDGTLYGDLNKEQACILPQPEEIILYKNGQSQRLLTADIPSVVEILQDGIPPTVSKAGIAMYTDTLNQIKSEHTAIELVYHTKQAMWYKTQRNVINERFNSLLFPLDGDFSNNFYTGEAWLGPVNASDEVRRLLE